MAVMVPREKWNDERVDDLSKKVDDGFARLDGEIKRLDGDIKDLRREMNARFDSVDARFDRMNDSINALQRNQIAGLFVIVAAILGSNAF